MHNMEQVSLGELFKKLYIVGNKEYYQTDITLKKFHKKLIDDINSDVKYKDSNRNISETICSTIDRTFTDLVEHMILIDNKYALTDNCPTFSYIKFRFSIKYPFSDYDAYNLMELMLNFFYYYGRRELTYIPTIIMKRQKDTPELNRNTYMTVYLPLINFAECREINVHGDDLNKLYIEFRKNIFYKISGNILLDKKLLDNIHNKRMSGKKRKK